jgi:hypothetical protein
MSFSLRVFFEDPFWVGLFTISEGASAKYCRVVFGGEPSEIEIYDFFQRNYYDLKFSESMPAAPEEHLDINPKRKHREVAKNLYERSSEKKSYEIIKQSMLNGQKACQKIAREQQKMERDAHKMQVKLAKRKEKHRGH